MKADSPNAAVLGQRALGSGAGRGLPDAGGLPAAAGFIRELRAVILGHGFRVLHQKIVGSTDECEPGHPSARN